MGKLRVTKDEVAMNRILKLIPLLLIILSGSLSAKPLHELTLMDERQVTELWSYLETLEDVSGSLSVEAASDNQRWRNMANSTRSLGFTKNPHWFRFSVINNTGVTNWELHIDHQQLNLVDIYVQDGQGATIERRVSGMVIPVSERAIKSAGVVESFEIPKGEARQFYLRVKTEFALNPPMQFGSSIVLAQQRADKKAFLFLFLGVMLAMMIFNLSVGISSKDRSYFYYVVYLIASTGYILQINGYEFVWGIIESPSARQLSVTLLVPVVFFFALQFSMSFLNLNEHSDTLGFIGRIIQGSCGLLIFLALLSAMHLYTGLATLIALIMVAFVFTAGIVVLNNGRAYAVWYLVAWGAFALGMIGHVAMLNGLIGRSFLVEEGLKIGVALETIFLSFALAKRISSIRKKSLKARLDAEQNLQQIQTQLEKTKDLQIANMRANDDVLKLLGRELRTPVNSLTGGIDLLKDQPGIDPELARGLEQATQEISLEVENLNVLAALDETSNSLHVHTINLSKQISEWQNWLENRLVNSKANFHVYNQCDGHQYWKVDRNRLDQIVYNLVINTIRLSQGGDLELTIQIDEYDPRNAYLDIRIFDSSSSISSELKDEIFKLFRKGSQATGKVDNKLGLGLSLVVHLTRMLQGVVELNSDSGQGAEITVRLPIQRAVPVQVPDPRSNKINQSNDLILCVDDNPVNLKVLGAILKKWRFQPVLVEKAEDAINLLAKDEFKMILMDLQMPEMDGLEATRVIRQRGYSLPIVAVSANAGTEEREASYAVGMQGFLQKPYRPAELRQALHEYIK